MATIRFDQTVKAAHEKAAKSDARSLSALVQKIAANWLRARKYLK